MQKNLNKIIVLAILFLASAGLWAALFFGISIEPFYSFGFLNRYKEWGESQNEVASRGSSQEHLAAMSTFLKETAVRKKDFEKYFIEGDSGRLLLLTSLEEAGRGLGATTTIVSVIERTVAPPKKKTTPKATQAGFVAGPKLAQVTDEISKNGPTSFFDITITARGSFQAVYQFINTLESLPFIITVNQGNLRLISDGAKSGASPTWEGSFQITVQSFKKTI